MTTMRTFKKIYLLALVTCFLLTACTDNFEEINNDPNRPKEVTPGVMLGQLQYRIVNSSMTGGRARSPTS